MNINEEFPSKYLKASDLQGRTITVKISHIDREKIGDDNKLVLYFLGKEKGMVLNKTNANNIAFVYGQETDDWQGADVQLYPTMVDFQRQSKEAIRVKPLPIRRAPAAQAGNGGNQQFPEEGSYGRVTSGRPAEPAREQAPLNDDIPF